MSPAHPEPISEHVPTAEFVARLRSLQRLYVVGAIVLTAALLVVRGDDIHLLACAVVVTAFCGAIFSYRIGALSRMKFTLTPHALCQEQPGRERVVIPWEDIREIQERPDAGIRIDTRSGQSLFVPRLVTSYAELRHRLCDLGDSLERSEPLDWRRLLPAVLAGALAYGVGITAQDPLVVFACAALYGVSVGGLWMIHRRTPWVPARASLLVWGVLALQGLAIFQRTLTLA